MNKHNEGEIGGGMKRAESENSLARHATNLVERYGIENKDKKLVDRLKSDWDNQTMDYNSMNFLEVFLVFGANTEKSVEHWRVAKIMEGISICNERLKITDGIGPTTIPKEIYTPLKEGRVNEKNRLVTIKNPNDENDTARVRASLADFAHFVDVIKANRELGLHRFDIQTLAFNYFTGRDLKKEVKDEKGKTSTIDIMDEQTNPRDDYKNLDINGYLKFIQEEKIQAGLQLMAEWRYDSEGHREMAGQAIEIQVGSSPADALFIPLSGRMAAKITMQDMLKQDKAGMMGQPQEVAECDEERTGAFIRFNLQDLVQRRRGGDIRNVNKSIRMGKAMCGLTLTEEAFSQIEKVKDEETKKDKTVIYICGKNLEGNIIEGMKARYDAPMKRVRGFGLDKKEAADLVMTDVIIPCVLNNPSDWLEALAKAYSVGGNKGAQSLLQNREVFQGFELRVMCRDMNDPPNFPIRLQTFKGFLGLQEYIEKRISHGHVDQPEAAGFAKRSKEDLSGAKEEKTENEYYLSTITDLQGSKIYNIFGAIFGEKANEYVAKYIKNGISAEIILDHGEKEKVIDKAKPIDLDSLFFGELCKLLKAENADAESAIEDLYEIELKDDTDVDFIIRGLQTTMADLSNKDRKKIRKS